MAEKGGLVRLSEGDYAIAASITMSEKNMVLEGAGQMASVLHVASLGTSVGAIAITNSGNHVKNMQLGGGSGTGYGVELNGANGDVHLSDLHINTFLYGVYGHAGFWDSVFTGLRAVSCATVGFYFPSTDGEQNGNHLTMLGCRASGGGKGLQWNAVGLSLLGFAAELCTVGIEIGGHATKSARAFEIGGGSYFEYNSVASLRMGFGGAAAQAGKVEGCYFLFSGGTATPSIDADGIINTEIENTRIGHNYFIAGAGVTGQSIQTTAADEACEIVRPVSDYNTSTYGNARVIQADQYLLPSAFTIAGAGTGANGIVLKNPKNAAASALSGTQKDVEIDIGGVPYHFTVYPTKA
jgi:hypothetical protein